MATTPPPISHSQTSLSTSTSPQRSAIQADVPIETLIQYLLASKRSLSSISTVWRANELVTSATSALEESVILNSRTAFLQKGIVKQTSILRNVRNGVNVVFREGQAEFEDVLRSLDIADSRLQETMDVLKSTIVEAAFRPVDEEPRSLIDFVDEDSVETMRTALKETIDLSQDAQAEFLSSIESYDNNLQSINAALSASSQSPTSSSQSHSSQIPPLLLSLENNASEMASLLESLVSHFDMCTTAIKHTEGGLSAVLDYTNENANAPSLSGVIGSPSNSSNLDAISDAERVEILQIISNDAAEVDDVVQDLHTLLAGMEDTFLQIQDHISHLNHTHKSISAAFSLLTSIGAKLPAYIQASQLFMQKWTSYAGQLSIQMEELDAMRVFYEGYLSSYDGLILEVERRRATEEKMKAVLRKAMESVGKLWETDRKERESFRRDVGEYLPSDLWEGLVGDAPRWEVGVVGSDIDGSGADEVVKSTPELKKVTVEEAFRREKDRVKVGR